MNEHEQDEADEMGALIESVDRLAAAIGAMTQRAEFVLSERTASVVLLTQSA